MECNVFWAVALCLALAGGAFAAQFAWKRGVERGNRQRDLELQATLDAAWTRLAASEAESEKHARLAQERFDMLDGVIQEKQIIWRMYRDSTRQAGVAQNWLMREYTNALLAVNAYRRKAGEGDVRVPEQLRALLAEYGATAAAVPDAPPDTLRAPANAPGDGVAKPT